MDSNDPGGTGKDVHGLLRFNLIGTGSGLIPPGSTIESASLTLATGGASGNGANFHRMLVPWPETGTWSSLGAGIRADGVEARSSADFTTGAMSIGSRSFDVKASVQAWANGAPNHGWAILPLGNDGWDFYSRQGTTPPKLVVTFIPPE